MSAMAPDQAPLAPLSTSLPLPWFRTRDAIRREGRASAPGDVTRCGLDLLAAQHTHTDHNAAHGTCMSHGLSPTRAFRANVNAARTP